MENNKKKKDTVKAYTLEMQMLYLNFMMSDPTAFTRCQNIVKDEYFNDRLKPAVRYILKFSDEFRALPTPEQVKAETNVQIEMMADIKTNHTDWFLGEIQEFCRHRAIENVSFESADLITEGRYSEYESRLKEALTITLQTDLGTSYFDDPKKRIKEVMDRSDMVSTGWKAIDDKLYGGFTKGALNIFAGGSGSGKSLFLQNLALNWAFMGFNVIYISLELSENLVSARLDSMVTGYSTKEIFRNIDNVDLKVRMQGKKAGDLRVKKMSEAGTSTNDIRAYLKEYEIQTGRKPDAVICDYLDLMYPNNAKINPSDMFVKDKFVAEELRSLAGELSLLFATASQLNRASVEAQEFDHSHIAGGISKINTADNVFGIYTSMAMKERGEYQLQVLKARSASCVGHRIELGYDQRSLRITDPDPEKDVTNTRSNNDIARDIKIQSQNKGGGTSVALNAPAQSAATAPNPGAMRAGMMDIINKVKRT
jgi:archaellum biogenesis ATPase FlaH